MGNVMKHHFNEPLFHPVYIIKASTLYIGNVMKPHFNEPLFHPIYIFKSHTIKHAQTIVYKMYNLYE